MAFATGSVTEIWRYPVKSMQGHSMSDAYLGRGGIAGDRVFAVRDEEVGAIQGARRHAGLLQCHASLHEGPDRGTSDAVAMIDLPDGTQLRSDDPNVDQRLSDVLGKPVTLHARTAEHDKRHYRRARKSPRAALAELRSIMDIRKGDRFPRLHRLPPSLLLNETLPGTYFDAATVLLLSKQSLDALQAELPDANVSVRRFRPNLVIDVPDAPSGSLPPEQGWLGRTVHVGRAQLKVISNCPRCVMTTREFEDVPQDRRILRTIATRFDRNFGVYAKVTGPGLVSVGSDLRVS
jgi:uncharacterized protein YcbX